MPIGFFLTDASELREKQLNKEIVELGKYRLCTELHGEDSYGHKEAVYGHTKVGHFFLHSGASFPSEPRGHPQALSQSANGQTESSLWGLIMFRNHHCQILRKAMAI